MKSDPYQQKGREIMGPSKPPTLFTDIVACQNVGIGHALQFFFVYFNLKPFGIIHKLSLLFQQKELNNSGQAQADQSMGPEVLTQTPPLKSQ